MHKIILTIFIITLQIYENLTIPYDHHGLANDRSAQFQLQRFKRPETEPPQPEPEKEILTNELQDLKNSLPKPRPNNTAANREYNHYRDQVEESVNLDEAKEKLKALRYYTHRLTVIDNARRNELMTINDEFDKTQTHLIILRLWKDFLKEAENDTLLTKETKVKEFAMKRLRVIRFL